MAFWAGRPISSDYFLGSTQQISCCSARCLHRGPSTSPRCNSVSKGPNRLAGRGSRSSIAAWPSRSFDRSPGLQQRQVGQQHFDFLKAAGRCWIAGT